MSDLRLLTFGGVRVIFAGQDVTAQLPTKAVSLMVYIARHKQPKSREHLAELFWPERRTEQAYGSLRTAISKIRPIVGDTLDVKHLEIGLNAWLDANHFEDHLHNPATIASALGLYQGAFMDGFYAKEAREFEHWQLRESENLHEKFIQATLQHIYTLQDQAAFEQAILSVRHALSHAPLREDLHRILIQLYHTTGERAAALNQYHICRSLLWEELGVDPDDSTQLLLQQAERSPAISSVLAPPRHKLPVRTTSFIGRGDALHQAQDLLYQSNLLTITAPGGAGKTRLALELAYCLQSEFRDGVFFVDFTKTSRADEVLPVLASSIGLYEDTHQDLFLQTRHYLQDRQILLILDNFEQVIEAAKLLSDLIMDASLLKVLVTCREPLKLYGEQVFHLAPLSLDESCQLFRERIRAIQADFHRTQAIDAQIEAICTHLDGLPLAIELAATRARTMHLDEILHGLTNRLTLLASDLRDIPLRQSALFHTIDWSYALLQPEQAALFRQLGIFKGGWTREALEHVSPHAEFLPDLIDKNLARRSVSGLQRYTMLGTMREYALYQLNKHDEAEQARANHAAWMLQFAEQVEMDLRTHRHAYTVLKIKDEQDNIRAALDYLADQPDQLATYARIISALGWFWNAQQQNHLPFPHVQKIIPQADNLPPSLRARLLMEGGHSAHALGHYDLADTWQQGALQSFEILGDERNAAYARFFLSARILSEEQAKHILFDLRHYALAQQDDFLLCMVNLNLGFCLHRMRYPSQSQAILQEGLDICERNQFTLFLKYYYINLSNVYAGNNNVREAFNLLERAHDLGQSEGNRFVEAASLIEISDLLLNIDRHDEMKDYLTQAEKIVHELGLPGLYARFYFLRGIYACFKGDYIRLKQDYARCMEYINPSISDDITYAINLLMHITFLQASAGDLPNAARMISGIDTYQGTAQTDYTELQSTWRNKIMQELNSAANPEAMRGMMQAGTHLSIQEVFAIAKVMLDNLTIDQHASGTQGMR